MIITITGPSGCGKSTLSKLWAEKYKYVRFCQDDFWVKDKRFVFQDNPYEEEYRFYELPIEYDGITLTKKVQDVVNSVNRNVIIEGFTVMIYPEIRKICHQHFYIDLPWEECVRRRLSRNKENDPNSTDSWIKLGERFNTLNVGIQKSLPNTVILDGMKTSDQLLEDMETVLCRWL